MATSGSSCHTKLRGVEMLEPQATDATQSMMERERNRMRQLRCRAFSCLISAHLRTAYNVLWSIIISAGLLRDLKKFNIFSCSFLPSNCRPSRKRIAHTSLQPSPLSAENTQSLFVLRENTGVAPTHQQRFSKRQWSSPSLVSLVPTGPAFSHVQWLSFKDLPGHGIISCWNPEATACNLRKWPLK